ncbi:MAG: energy-coupling factor transporter transmembrane protein EcfT [Eubacterium sp.]|nr:energy-coupling factor transporter transmembrane protein EcfT [Eubacterium sp.]
MPKGLTIGSYYPVDSPIHRLDPRVKLVAVLVFLVSLFLFDNFIGYIVVTVFLGAVIILSKVPLKYILKGMKFILFLLFFTAFFNLFFTHGEVVFSWKFISITKQGIRLAAFIALRLIYLVIGSSMLTYTTTPGQLTDGIESLLGWLIFFRVPVHDFATMMSLALRFIPILMMEANRIIDAQTARGARFDGGGLIRKIKSYVSLIVPLFVSATGRAYELGLAMESRCYNGSSNRTKLKPLKHRLCDVMMYPMMVGYIFLIVYLGRLPIW